MPTITAQARPTQGSSPDQYTNPRKTISQSTGMAPVSTQVSPSSVLSIGQTAIKEELKTPVLTLSPQLTALAKKQQKLQADIQAQREKESKWEQERSSYVAKTEFKTKAQQNAQAALQELGMSYNEITELLLNQQNGSDPVRALQTKVEQLEKSQEENVNKQYEATIKQYQAETHKLVQADPKKYFLIQKKDASKAVVQHIVDTWEADPDQVLTVDEAAQDVEEFLREQAREEKALLEELDGPKETQEETVTKTAKKLPLPQAQARTLTNQVESAAPPKTYKQFQHMSMKERLEAATQKAQRR